MPYAEAPAVKILRVERAADTLPQTATEGLFTIRTGTIRVHEIVGVVTTAIQNQLNNLSLSLNSDESVTDVPLCAVANSANLAVGSVLTITGTVADALQTNANGAVRGLTTPLILRPGAIQLIASASNTGAIRWTIFYTPVDTNATVTATAV